jgi:PPOX class probable F420-dependent enzyme
MRRSGPQRPREIEGKDAAAVDSRANGSRKDVWMATELDDARYINLLSFKRDGNGVETPVWAAPLDGKLVIFTNRDSYKVKRVRRNPKVRVARCDGRGKLLGPWIDGTCTIAEDPSRHARIMDALNAKYGWQIRVLNFFSTLSGRAKRRAYLEVTIGG